MLPFPTTPKEAGKGVLISFVSTKQGAGASTLACLAALTLSGVNREVALIDFNPESKIRSYMGYPTGRETPVSILNIQSVFSSDMIYTASEIHQSNIKIFPGVPHRPLDASMIDAGLLLKGTTLLKQTSPITIANLGPLYGPSWVTAMLSDIVCVVARPDRPNMDAFIETTDFLARLGREGKIQIILNQQKYPGSIQPKDALRHFSPDVVIPYNKAVAESANRRDLKPDTNFKNFFLKLIREVEETE